MHGSACELRHSVASSGLEATLWRSSRMPGATVLDESVAPRPCRRVEVPPQYEPNLRLLADAIRSCPVSLSNSGAPRLQNIATGQTRAMIQRACGRIEIEGLNDLANRRCPGEHRTLDVHEYEWLIYGDLMAKVKIALGETGRVETSWSS